MTSCESMHTALKTKKSATVKRLLNDDPELLVQRSEYNRSWLHIASQTGCEESVRHFIELGLDPNELDERQMTPLWIALMAGQSAPVAKALLEAGADPNFKRGFDTLLHEAAGVDRSEHFVGPLLAHGGDPNVLDDDGRSPLSIAARRSELASVKLLLAHGADPLLCRPGYRPNAYEEAKQRGTEEVYAVVHAWLQAKAIRDIANSADSLSAGKAPRPL